MTPAALAAFLLFAAPARAQVDPDRRRLVQFGYDQNFSGPGPTGAYAFYYMNEPEFPSKGMSLRVALAPVYVDSELAVKSALGENTDVGLGLAGGGFADSYAEVHQGHYARDESFVGHGGKASLSLYHLFDPGAMIPLNGVLRGIISGSSYSKTSDTAAGFSLPPDGMTYITRAGLRLGGEPPQLMPRRSAELSVWYEGRWREHPSVYGFDGDRSVNPRADLVWSRALFAYRPESGRRFRVSMEAGTSRNADRLDTYRLGGFLPFASEFPLSIPGFYNGEISARRYVLMTGLIEQPLDEQKRWSADLFGSAADTTYLQGLGQQGPWNEGAGVGLVYDSPNAVWKVASGYAYGISAIRAGGRGAHSAMLLVQLDLEAWKKKQVPSVRRRYAPIKPEGLDWLFQMFKP